MELSEEFGRYLGHISASLGRAERKAGLQEYCRALMLPLKRKSIERPRPLIRTTCQRCTNRYTTSWPPRLGWMKSCLARFNAGCCQRWRRRARRWCS